VERSRWVLDDVCVVEEAAKAESSLPNKHNDLVAETFGAADQARGGELK
jgi:hypothetical protein